MFKPRYLKHGHLLVRHAEKLLRYRKDVLSDATTADLKTQIDKLRDGLRARDKRAVKEESERLHNLYTKHMPAGRDAGWRENVEVILVAVVVAVAIRSYFLQPFKIPTGSMQPTLNGIIGHRAFFANENEIPVDQKDSYEKHDNGWYLKGYPTDAGKPNLLRQVAEFLILGRNYIDVVSEGDDRVVEIKAKKIAFFLTFTEIICEHQSFTVYAPPETLAQDFKVLLFNQYKRGQIIARGAIDTGDQVFVDKFSYNFVKPHRGDVFVFRTEGINERNRKEGNPRLIQEDPGSGSPFYIKRLAGLPGDTLRIEQLQLYVNGRPAEGFGFQRVMGAKPPYGGYSDGPLNVHDLENRLVQIRVEKETAIGPGNSDRAAELQIEEQRVKGVLEFAQGKRPLPRGSYFALGDNSFNSYDSRYWGPVPEENLVGRGLLVYWPFNRHWGLIR
jgi:signal peptidase I